MRKSLLAIVALAIPLGACGRSQPAGPGAQEAVATPSVVTLTLPPGDVAAGRQAFQDLKCTACHAVASESDFPPPVATDPGPVIDASVARQGASYLVMAIVSPSHTISPGISASLRSQLGGVLSPMGDFSQVMTVRQLLDLNAYLGSLR